MGSMVSGKKLVSCAEGRYLLKIAFEQRPEVLSEQTMQIAEEKALQRERTASAKALRQE